MARRVLLFVWAVGILGQASVRTILLVHYRLEREVYVKRCENAARPELDCQGKCYLKKRMMAVEGQREDRQQPLPAFFFSLKDLPLFWEDGCKTVLPMQDAEGMRTFPSLRGRACRGCLSDVFHPPC